MRIRLLIAVLLVLLLAHAARTESRAITFYVQLVRPSNTDTRPEPNSKRIGQRLFSELHGPLKWEDYWEINRQELSVRPGRAARVRLCDKCEVEIDLTDKQHRKVTAFRNGKVIGRVCTTMGPEITLIGGNEDDNGAMFVAVRRDRPPI